MCKGNESRLLVDDEEKFIRNGEPTEAAIRVLVEKLGCPDEAVNQPLASVRLIGWRKVYGGKKMKKTLEGLVNYWLPSGKFTLCYWKCPIVRYL